MNRNLYLGIYSRFVPRVVTERPTPGGGPAPSGHYEQVCIGPRQCYWRWVPGST
jgi:hypothetical protein